MLTTEIRVNGALIGHLCLVNQGVKEGDQVVYSAEYYRTGNGMFRTSVLHAPEEGAEVLVEKALKAIRKEMKK